jgi:segregation and condensation protein A
LLPSDEREDYEDLLGDARDLLYARLLEYRAYRDVSRLIAHRMDRFSSRLPREVAPESWMLRLVPDTPLPIDVEGLAALAASATAPRPDPEVDLTHIRRSYLTIREAALQVLEAIPEPGKRAIFSALVEGRGRGDRVVLFLALLELFKLGHVDLDQRDLRSALAVERRAGGYDLGSLTDEDLDADAEGGADAAVDGPGGEQATDPVDDRERGTADEQYPTAGGAYGESIVDEDLLPAGALATVPTDPGGDP